MAGAVSVHRAPVAILALLAAANSLSASFSVFYLLGRWLAPWQAAAMALGTFCGALAGAALLGWTRLGALPPRLQIAAGIGLLLLHYDFLAVIEVAPAPAAAGAALAFGAFIAVFFIPYNTAILALSRTGNRGTVIGGYGLVIPLGATVGPLAGAWLIANRSFVGAVLFSTAIVAATSFIALRSSAFPPAAPFSLTRAIAGVFPRRAALGLFSEGVFEGSLGAAQPVLAAVYLGSEQAYGNLLFLFSLAGAAAALALARLSDRVRDRVLFLRVGVLVLVPATLIGLFFPQYIAFAAALSLVSAGLPIAAVFLFAIASDAGAGRPHDVAMWREVLLNSGRVLGAATVLAMILAVAWPTGAFLAMLGATLAMALTRR